MNLYSENKNYKLYQGSMLDMLEVIEPNSIDSIVTDPPYELNFMGKGWDNAGVSFNKETWEKCFEVLKDGGYLLAFGGSRTYHRIAVAIEDAGFEIRDTIMWLYGSGFPKSMDISKQIDKKGGNDYSKQFAKDLKQARESRNLTMKYCDDKYCNSSTNWSWYEGRKDGCRVPDYQTYLEIIKEFPELGKYRKLIKEAKREVIGTKKGVGCFNNDKHYTVGGTKANDYDITIASTDLAKQWQGWGTCLKPSFEPIIVARKPFKGSLVDNVIANGVGGLNIDECRIGNKGRFPANVIHDGLSEEWSRYFYCAKASKKDRDEGLEEFENKIDCDRNPELKSADVPMNRSNNPRKNIHPTVKPTELMQYLVRLVTPNNGTILDAFNGSGSTGKAVMYENKERNKNYKYIGIELTEEYLPIAQARIEYVSSVKEEPKETTIFDYI